MKANNPKKPQKVYVGMSGGVDSSVSAALLKDQGYDVTGVFIKVWQPDFLPCNWKEERRDAMRVAAHLDIPFITLDLEKEYKEEVVDYMIREYKQGRTPNPDVMCNRFVKFGGFFDWAMKQGADFVATGHYARVDKQSEGDTKNSRLLKGRDDNKDQSYFLWTLTKEKLSKTLFPVGDIPKPEVRVLAKKFNLPNAEKKDSQGLCFVGKIDMKEFLKHYIDEKPGDVLNESGEVIGHHEGALFYTHGERHGFIITKKTAQDEPCFVIAKDSTKNTLTVSSEKYHSNRGEQVGTVDQRFNIKETNWVGNVEEKNKTYKARVRYRGALHDVRIETILGSKAIVIFPNFQDVVSPGQSIVVYDGEECVGGGVVD
jgi:tRNA-specific 2-thiouridylase